MSRGKANNGIVGGGSQLQHDYVENIKPINQIQHQLLNNNYASNQPVVSKPYAPKAKKDNGESIFDLANQRSDSKGSLRGLHLKGVNNNKPKEVEIQIRQHPLVQMEAGPGTKARKQPMNYNNLENVNIRESIEDKNVAS